MIGIPEAVDVAIAGAGPAGATTALLLARAGVSTLLIDPSLGRPGIIGQTLPPVANGLIAGLGLWNSFRHQKHLSSPGIVTAWGTNEVQVKDYFSSATGPGWNLDRQIFDASLIEESRKVGTCICNGRVISCLWDPVTKSWDLHIRRQNSIHYMTARHLVDATGRIRSSVFQNLSTTNVLDRLIAVLGVFRPANHITYSLTESVDDGWFFSTRLPDGCVATTYFTDADIYAQEAKGNRSYLTSQLQKAEETRKRVAASQWSDRTILVSAATARRNAVSGEGWTAVGDAAFALDPLSSLGIFKALDSARRAFIIVTEALQNKEPNTTYQDWADTVFQHYLHNRARLYSREHRWRTSLFWKRRQELGRIDNLRNERDYRKHEDAGGSGEGECAGASLDGA